MTRATILLTVWAISGCMAGPGDRAVGSIDEAAKVCAAGATVTGIDVSHYQNTVDWAKVAASGRKFGIVKATEGTGITDSTFAANWSAMKKAGILRSAYHFFRSNLDAKAQAQLFVNTVGALGADDLPLMLDLETTDGASAATIASKAQTFLQTVEQMTGKKPIVYTYPDFWQNQIGAPSGFAGYPLNIANYGVTCPTVVGSWPTWTMWQNSSTGSVSGVTGDVDEDVFNGDLAALMQLAGGSGSGSGNPCTGLADGYYCGGDGLAGDKNTLYECSGGNVSSMKACASGCKYNPPGTPDACNPDPPAPDGGTGGGGSGGGGAGGGGVGGGGAADNPGGGSMGDGSGTGGGCAMAGAPGNDAAAAVALLGLLALALRRRRA